MTASGPAGSPARDEIAERLASGFADQIRAMGYTLVSTDSLAAVSAEVARLRAENERVLKKLLDATAPERTVRTAIEMGRTTGMSPERAMTLLNDVTEKLDLIRTAQRQRDVAVSALKDEHQTHRMVRVAHVGGTDYICGLCQQEPRSQWDPIWPCEAVKRIDAALVAALDPPPEVTG